MSEMPTPLARLGRLAALYGIKTSYLDVKNQVKAASKESLAAALRALGVSVDSDREVKSALREKQQSDWQRVLEPVTVVWEGQDLVLQLRLPAELIPANLSTNLSLEDGREKELDWRIEESAIIGSATVEGSRYVNVRLYLPEVLPLGYHRLKFSLPGRSIETLVISAPLKACMRPPEEKIWGAFLPLYALHSRRSWGAGDLGDLAKLVGWSGKAGAKVVGTLPLLPSFFDKQKGPGPYLPASRLFWNELYLDIGQSPELTGSAAARELMDSEDYRKNITGLSNAHSIDYSFQLFLKRKVIEQLAEEFFQNTSPRREAFERYVKANPRMEEYAEFRAAGEFHGLNWHDWPKHMRKRTIKKQDYAESVRQYYLYSQWLAKEQMEALNSISERNGVSLYMDLPVGVHPYSYDIWAEPEIFVQGASGGAPPDPVFTNGQNWDFPPLHPEKVREQGYRYIIASLRHQLEVARMLRIDHMMNYHRLFWIPQGLENAEGLYVGYRAEELYAILTLESNRHGALIVGEDLGMVPPEVRPMMEKHGVYRTYVGQYDFIAEGQVAQPPSRCVASLNTHDMFPFAAFWEEKDIEERLKLKLINARQAQEEMEQRRSIKRSLISALQYRGLNNEIAQDTLATLKAVLGLLAASPAYALLINLEDLWLETRPQNVPGMNRSQNWSRKARFALEDFSKMAQVTDMLAYVARERAGKKA
jgi:4-alpha-glucanotransferase